MSARVPVAEGVNVVGYLRAEVGVGEAGRKAVAALRAARVPHATINHARTLSRQSFPFELQERVSAPYRVNLLCVNADETPRLREELGPHFFAGRYTIGLWFWEIEVFPPALATATEVVDEVWTASGFVREAVAKAVAKPVHVFPLPVQAPPGPFRLRSELGLPPEFLYYFSFDFLSVFERKNPLGVVEAFKRAFDPGEGPVLLVKSVNGDRFRQHLAALERAAEGRADVRVMDGYVSPHERDELVAACDCYVSLHRSEGFGLTIAEAMALGKPAIATGYSGNLEFMTDENSYLVPFRRTSIPEGCGPYPAGAEWADPDLDHAGRLMRTVYEDRAAARAGRARS